MSERVSVIGLDERTPCLLCNGERLCFEKGYGPDLGICSVCADEVVDLYFLTHSGERFFQDWEKPGAIKKPVSQKVKWQVLRRDGFCCQECGSEDRPLQVDHIQPRAKGGSNSPENLQALCDKCNLQKGAK